MFNRGITSAFKKVSRGLICLRAYALLQHKFIKQAPVKFPFVFIFTMRTNRLTCEKNAPIRSHLLNQNR